MSCIFGIILFHKKEVAWNTLENIMQTMNHWNADDTGIWHTGSVGLGHLMLYNTPESLQEKLPLHNSRNHLTITADARIDNREELAGKINLTLPEIENLPDSVLILKTYEQYGENCVQHLIGDFAFAIWDANEEKLFCARDQMGIRPFYYYRDDHFFAFASEKKGLLSMEQLNKTINEPYLLKIAANVDPHPEETLYSNVKRLQGAHSITLLQETIHLHKYWDLDATQKLVYGSSQEYLDAFLAHFTQAVQCRLRSAFPVGAELSGGLDSSGIACVAANLLHTAGKQLTSFSYGFSNEAERDSLHFGTEVHFADEVISFAKIDNPIKVSASGYADLLEEADLSISINEGPYHRSIWYRAIKKAAADNNIKTLLSGFPGDELVTNYSKQYPLEYAASHAYIRYFNTAIKELGVKNAVKHLLLCKLHKPLNTLLRKHRKRKQVHKAKTSNSNFLQEPYFSQIENTIVAEDFPADFRALQKTKILQPYISERMELEVRIGLQHKVDTRFPMADIRLLQFVLSIPAEEKMQFGKDRWLYRRAMKNIIPGIVLERKDKSTLMQPFYVKERALSQEKVKHWLQQLASQQAIPPYINYARLLEEFSRTIDGKGDKTWTKYDFISRKILSILR